MAKKKPSQPRGRAKEANPRKFKKKTSVLVTEKVEYIDYKDVDLLQRFLSDRAKIRNSRVSGNDVQQQREVARAIKNAREMGLLPYAKRVASPGRSRPPRDDDRRSAPAEVTDEAIVDEAEEIVADEEMLETVEMADAGGES